MTPCRGAHDALSRFIDGESPAAEAARVRAHLAACAACRAEADALARTHAAIARGFAKHPFDQAFAKRVAATAHARATAGSGERRARVIPGPWARLRRGMPAAAAAALVVAAGLGAWIAMRGESGSGTLEKPAVVASVRASEGARLRVARGSGLGDVTTVAPGQSVELRAGDTVAVDLRGGEIEFTDATRVLVRPDTSVRVGERSVAIVDGPGELFCQASPQAEGRAFRVETPAAIAQVTGTSFGVRYESGVAYATVLDGKVSLATRDGGVSVNLSRNERGRMPGPDRLGAKVERVDPRRELAWALGTPPAGDAGKPARVPSLPPEREPARPAPTPTPGPSPDLPIGADRPGGQ